MKRPAKKERRKPKQGDSITLKCKCGCSSFDVVMPTGRFGLERVKCARCGALWPLAVEER